MLKKSLSEQIHEQLKKDIIHQKIKLGEKLINKNLQERFGVSSSPVRDAVNKLYFDGLLTSVTQAGAQVIELDEKNFRETNEILSMLNCATMKKAFNNNINEQIKLLDDCIKMQLLNIDNEDYYKYDYKFHKTFFDYGDNEKCKELFKTYVALHELLVRYYHKGVESKRIAIEGHKKIIADLKSNNINEACKEMEKHYTLSNNKNLGR
ncbi:MAG: GntR family transcriptional regulator [Lachnospirales bacterium]